MSAAEDSRYRLLVVRTSALGDVVHCLPTLGILRRRFPRARIAWVVERAFAPLLDSHPDVDEVVPVGFRTWRRRPFAASTRSEIRAFLRQLDDFAPQIVIDLMGNHKAGIVAALTLCDRRIGAARRHRREPSSAIWISEPVEITGVHAVDRAVALLAPLGAADQAVRFEAEKILPQAPPAPRTPQIVVVPGAGWANKRYPPERWAAVLRKLQRRTGMATGVLPGPGEESLAHEVAAGCHATVLSAPSLAELVGHLRAAWLVLGGDTGPVHLAHALGRRVLCLMGPTDPERTGPYGAPQRALSGTPRGLASGHRDTRPDPYLSALEPEAVVERALAVLAEA